MAEDNEEPFHIIPINDDKAKIIAMELANDKGRMVLEAIFEGKKSSSDIANELDMSLPTVLFHIERLREAGVIKVIDTNLSKKFREIKYYGPTKKAILIVPSKDKETIEEVVVSYQSSINPKLIGITGVMGAIFAGGLIRLFSKTTVLNPATDQEILSYPPKDVFEETGRIAVDTIQTLPSPQTIAALVVVAAILAMSIMMAYHRHRSSGKKG